MRFLAFEVFITMELFLLDSLDNFRPKQRDKQLCRLERREQRDSEQRNQYYTQMFEVVK